MSEKKESINLPSVYTVGPPESGGFRVSGPKYSVWVATEREATTQAFVFNLIYAAGQEAGRSGGDQRVGAGADPEIPIEGWIWKSEPNGPTQFSHEEPAHIPEGQEVVPLVSWDRVYGRIRGLESEIAHFQGGDLHKSGENYALRHIAKKMGLRGQSTYSAVVKEIARLTAIVDSFRKTEDGVVPANESKVYAISGGKIISRKVRWQLCTGSGGRERIYSTEQAAYEALEKSTASS